MKKVKIILASSGLFSVVLGLMLVFLRGSVLSLVITLIGIGFIVSGLSCGLKPMRTIPLVKIIIGICAIAFGNTFIGLSMYILGITLTVLGISQLINVKNVFSRPNLAAFTRPALTLIAGVSIIFNPWGSMDTLFLVCGILLAVGGAWDLYRVLKINV